MWPFAKRIISPGTPSPTFGGNKTRIKTPALSLPEGCEARAWLDARRIPGKPDSHWRIGHMTCLGLKQDGWISILHETISGHGSKRAIEDAAQKAEARISLECARCILGNLAEIPDTIGEIASFKSDFPEV